MDGILIDQNYHVLGYILLQGDAHNIVYKLVWQKKAPSPRGPNPSEKIFH